jgi:hypothetical protein
MGHTPPSLRFLPTGRCPLQTEQLLRVTTTNLQAVCFAERHAIEPVGCDTHVFERKMNRVQNAVGADFKHDFCQSLRPEICARRDVEILPPDSGQSDASL